MADGKVTIAVDLDGKKAQGDINSLKSSLGGLGSAFKSVLGANLVSGALMSGISALTGGVKSAFSSAIDEGAKLQQSIGGIETLFKDSAGTVKQYANEAFRTAGVSANEYMENVTSFSASLISSLGGDTAKAAELANTAMTDMSDNANKMGSDMKIITQTYQSLARGNYAMLDNLKLGYGGTKAEMQRLIKDAASYKDVQEELNMTVDEGDMSFANMVKAISVVQKKLGITGTTAKEASETFSGSFASMQAAFKDFLGNLTTGGDISKPLGNLAKTASTFIFRNFIPMVGNAFKSLPKAISTFLASAKPELEAGLKKMLPEEMVNNIMKTFDKVGNFLSSFKNTGAITAVAGAFNAVKDAIGHVFSSLAGSGENFDKIAKALGEVVKFLADAATKGAEFISSLPPETIKQIAGAVAGAVFAFKGFKAVTGILQGLLGVFQLIKFALTANPFMLAVVAIGALVGAFITAYNTSDTFRAKVDGVVKSIKKFVDGLDPQLVKSWAATIGAVAGGFAVFKMLNGWNPFKMFSRNGEDALDAVGDALDKTSGKSKKAKGIITQVFTGLGNLIKSAGQGIATAAKGIGTGLSTAFKGLGTGIATASKGIGTAVSTMAQGFGRAAAMANPAQWLSMGAAMLMVGAGVALVAAGIYILVQAAIQLGNAGTSAQLAMLGLGVGIAVLAGIFALLGPALTASAVGILAFGASVALIGAGIAIAAYGLSTLVNAFANAEGAITATGQAISTAAQGIGQGLQTALNGAARVVESFGTAIKTALEGVANVFKSVGEAIRTVLDGIKGVIESVGNSFTQIGDSLAKIASNAGGIMNAAAGVGALAAAVTGLGAASYAGNLVGFTGDIEKLNAAISNLGSGFAGISSSFQTIGTSMSLIATSSMMAVTGLTNFSTQITSLSTTLGLLPSIMTMAVSGFTIFTAQILSSVAGLAAINAPIAMFNSQIMTMTPALMMAGTSFTMLGSWVMIVGTALATVSSGFIQVGSSATSASSQVTGMATSTQSVISAFNSMHGQVQSSMQAILSVIKSVGSQMGSQGRQIGQQTAQNIAQGIRGGIGQSQGAMQALMSSVRSVGMSRVGSMRSIGSMIGQGLAQGMYSALGAVTAAADALVAQAERAARAKAKIHSPSRLFRDSVGRFLPMGVAVGIEKNTKYVDKAMFGMYDNIQAFNYKAEDIIGVGKTKLSKVVQVKSDLEKAVKASIDVKDNNQKTVFDELLRIGDKLVNKSTYIVLETGELVGGTIDAYTNAQAHNTRVKNRMRGIVT